MKGFPGLREYLGWLESKGLLLRVDDELSPILEIPAVLRKAMYSKMPALLFENVKGYPEWRVTGNIFLSPELYAEYSGVEKLEEIGEKLLRLISPRSGGMASSLRDLMRSRHLFAPIKKVGRAPFTGNIVEENPLDKIPAFKTWRCDGSRYLTYPLVVTRDPESGALNIGVYRVMITSGTEGVVHWQIHKRGAMAYMEWKDETMPVAIAIGGSIHALLTGASPVPRPIDKFLFMSLLSGSSIPVYTLPNGLPVPADSEAVIEGYIVRGEEREEGPFGDHFGYCDKPVEKYPVLHVERMYYRDNPIYYGSVVGPPPLEDAVIGKIIERVFLPFMRFLAPEIVDISFPEHGCFQGMMVVSINKSYPGQAKKVMNAIWGLSQASLTKIIVVVDSNINVHDLGEVVWAISANTLPDRDVVIIGSAHTDALDPSSIYPGLGGKLGIDATRKLPEENHGKPWPTLLEEDPVLADMAESLLKRLTGLHKND